MVDLEVLLNTKTGMYSVFHPGTKKSIRLVYSSAKAIETLYPGIVKSFPGAKELREYVNTH